MKIDSRSTDEAVLAEFGNRLATLRLERNLTQSQLAREAGVSKPTLQRMESGAVATQLSSFLRVCRALGLLERFEKKVGEWLIVAQQVDSPTGLVMWQVRAHCAGIRLGYGLHATPEAEIERLTALCIPYEQEVA